MTNTFCFGYGIGYKFSETRAGSANGNFLGIGADCCERAVLVEQCQPPGLLITNGEFVGRWSSAKAITFEVTEKAEGKISLTNCSFWGPIDKCVVVRAPKAQFTANACNFVHWDCRREGMPAIDIQEGRAIIQGCSFGNSELAVRVGRNAKSVVVTGNQAEAGVTIENYAGDRTQAAANEPPKPLLAGKDRANYSVSIGSDEDERVAKNWHGRETASEWGGKGTKRWSGSNSTLILPVIPGKPYEVTLDVFVPEHAVEPAAGVYLGTKRIIAFSKPGRSFLIGQLPASKADRVTLEIRCRGWVPKDVTEGSSDPRTLGVAVRSVRMKSK